MIDPLDALADVAAAEDLWFHVDGAYGAFGVLDPAIAARYRGMERADSLVLDPHKWLGVPVDAGCALVRRGVDLRDAFSLIPPYLRQDAGARDRHVRRVRARADATVPRAEDVGDDRRPRPRRHRRPGGARERARTALAALVERDPELELAAAPETSIVAFRARPAGCPPDALEAVNRALPEAVQARGRAFVTGTVLDGRETLRACILHPATRARSISRPSSRRSSRPPARSRRGHERARSGSHAAG